MVGVNDTSVPEPWGQPTKNPRSHGQSIFLYLEMSLMVSSGTQVPFLSGLHRSRHEFLSSLHQVLQLQFLRLQEKGWAKLSMIPSEKNGKNPENISLEICYFRYFRRLEEFRI